MIHVAAIQMVSSAVVAENLRTATRLIADAAATGAQLVVLPEYFPLIGASGAARLAAREQPGAGPIQTCLAENAQKNKVWLVGGSIPLYANAASKFTNSCLVFNPAGETVVRYDKLHLFGFDNGVEHYDEAQFIEAGAPQPVSFQALGLSIGIGICYDLRFPEFFRALGEVDLIVLPAAFTVPTGRAHWELLLRARAVENQCFVLAAAQGGAHPGGRVTFGHSMLIDPWGEIIRCLDTGAGIVTGSVDPQRILHIRRQLPALRHRRMF